MRFQFRTLPHFSTTVAVFMAKIFTFLRASILIFSAPRHYPVVHINKLCPCIHCTFHKRRFSLNFLNNQRSSPKRTQCTLMFFLCSPVQYVCFLIKIWPHCSRMLLRHILMVPHRIPLENRELYFLPSLLKGQQKNSVSALSSLGERCGRAKNRQTLLHRELRLSRLQLSAVNVYLETCQDRPRVTL